MLGQLSGTHLDGHISGFSPYDQAELQSPSGNCVSQSATHPTESPKAYYQSEESHHFEAIVDIVMRWCGHIQKEELVRCFDAIGLITSQCS